MVSLERNEWSATPKYATDLLLGIEYHRSIFTHSILPGIVIETAVRSTLELVQLVHGNLPPDHDVLWDELVEGGEAVAEGLHRGVSLGIAYHLGVDATIDGAGTYADLPVSVPMEVHQAIAAVAAATEGVDAVARKVGPVEVQHFETFAEASEYARQHERCSVRRSGRGGFSVLQRQ